MGQHLDAESHGGSRSPWGDGIGVRNCDSIEDFEAAGKSRARDLPGLLC
jgi:hypothetical protein